MSRSCNLIIDSCCDLPFAAVNRPGVFLLEFPYLVNGEERVDDFYRSTTPKEFFDGMRNKKNPLPTTSQLPTHVLDRVFREALDAGLPVVYLSFSSGLTGSYDAACLVRESVLADYPDGRLDIVDTKLASIAEGLLVLAAIEQQEAGLDADEMVAWAEEARWFVNAQFMIDDLSALEAGGRIPPSMALAGSKLDVKPLLGFDLAGKLTLVGVVRGRKKGVKSLVAHLQKHIDDEAPSQRVIIADADCSHDSARLRDEIAKVNGNALFLESKIGPVIGTHVGPEMLACVFWGDDRRSSLSISDRIASKVKSREKE